MITQQGLVLRKIVDIPDLIGMQRESFARFLQMDIPPEEREEMETCQSGRDRWGLAEWTGRNGGGGYGGWTTA